MTLPSQPILGLIDGMEVLQLLSACDREMSGIEIAQSLNIEKTKVNRILKTLAYQGFASATTGRKYALGPAIHVLSSQMLHGSGLINKSMKFLEELTQLEVVVAMGVLWRDKVAYTYHWKPGITPVEGIGRMGLFPATQSSIGLQLLSQKSNEEIVSIIDFDADTFGFEDKTAFWECIEGCRENGYAQNTYNGNDSIAVSLGHDAYAGLALAQNNNNEKIINHISTLQKNAQLIEQAVPNL